MAEPARGQMRSAARLAAVQALYEMEVSGKGVLEAMAEFEAHWIGREVEGVEFQPAEAAFFRDILRGVVREQGGIDRKIDEALVAKWPLKRVEPVLRAVLRAGAYELLYRRDVPAKAAISEYVDVTRAFYDGEEVGLVNAVLDQLARQTRADELGKRT
ncbi:transcription antitermination factor NusB [Chelatococcus reniformis]|uniref:Transcription antitermination protein NusB n=1 Tax=Chelatococcus reniformis TaxID=1494448 RepID=A0A916UIJ6_9HYPH|nr:transcription antitermination factor NusB [Chelatococcus reniformis]GGC74014.1 N utilization substance protein B [Chelatococcus reniformis]